jgi:methionyl-tRNA formyltransferase
MGVVFFGASELGFDSCESLIKAGIPVNGLVTVPRQFNISYSKDKPVTNYLFKDFQALAEKYNLPLVTIETKIKDYKEQIKSLNPDVILVIGWYHMIPAEIRMLAPMGCVGIHASLLPKYRGGAPLVWAMINGETKTGISLFYFEDGVDNGDIIDQVEIEIGEKEYISDILAKVKDACINTVQKNIPLLLAGKADRRKQNEEEATYFPQRKPDDGLIDLSWDAKRIFNFVRAQASPYPGAYLVSGDGKKVFLNSIAVQD